MTGMSKFAKIDGHSLANNPSPSSSSSPPTLAQRFDAQRDCCKEELVKCLTRLSDYPQHLPLPTLPDNTSNMTWLQALNASVPDGWYSHRNCEFSALNNSIERLLGYINTDQLLKNICFLDKQKNQPSNLTKFYFRQLFSNIGYQLEELRYSFIDLCSFLFEQQIYLLWMNRINNALQGYQSTTKLIALYLHEMPQGKPYYRANHALNHSLWLLDDIAEDLQALPITFNKVMRPWYQASMIRSAKCFPLTLETCSFSRKFCEELGLALELPPHHIPNPDFLFETPEFKSMESNKRSKFKKEVLKEQLTAIKHILSQDVYTRLSGNRNLMFEQEYLCRAIWNVLPMVQTYFTLSLVRDNIDKLQQDLFDGFLFSDTLTHYLDQKAIEIGHSYLSKIDDQLMYFSTNYPMWFQKCDDIIKAFTDSVAEDTKLCRKGLEILQPYTHQSMRYGLLKQPRKNTDFGDKQSVSLNQYRPMRFKL